MSNAFPRLSGNIALAILLVLVLAVPQVKAAPPARVDVLIGFNNAPGANDLAFVRGQGGRIKYTYDIVPAVAANVPQQALAGLANHPNVALIELDGTVQAVETEYEAAWGVGHIGAEVAHLMSYTGTGVNVAVIDSGIDYNHAEFTGNYVSGYDFENNDSDPLDDNSHGTHCAGTIAALADGTGVVGVASNVSIYALKVLDENGSGSFSNVVAALNWSAANGMHVTSNSYGSSQNPGGIVEQAFINANAAGILNIAAAGNSGNFKGKGNNVIYPAAYDSVVAVAATDSADNRAYFSSTGSDVELAAPGYLIYSTVPGGGYGYKSGTSMACPHVAGVAALLIGAGGLDNQSTRDLMNLSAKDLGSTGRDNQFGYGLVDVPMALLLLDEGDPPPPEDPPPPGEEIAMKVAAIDYSLSGGRFQDKDLNIAVTIEETVTGLPVPNASVSIIGYFDGSDFGSASGTTNSSGVVVFKVRNAPSGEYFIDVTSVDAVGYSWDLVTPPNLYNKP